MAIRSMRVGFSEFKERGARNDSVILARNDAEIRKTSRIERMAYSSTNSYVRFTK